MTSEAIETRLSRLQRATERRLGAYRATPLAFAALSIMAFAYYAGFYNYSFNIGDEGSVALISERLAHGEVPYHDIEIGYGILWYLPIVLLFKLFGPEFYLIKIYFLFIGFLSAVFAYAVLLRLTAHRILAFAVAVVVLLFPGVNYQTYIPFLVVSGLYVLLLYDIRTVRPVVAPWLALSFNGLYIAVAFLIRPDIATAYTVLIIGYHALLAGREAIEGEPFEAASRFFARLSAIGAVAILVTLPFAIEANSNGYLQEFLRRYWLYAEGLLVKIPQRLAADSPSGAGAAVPLMPRLPPQAFFWPNHPRGLIFLTYAPLLVVLPVLGYVAIDFFRRLRSLQAISDFIGERTYLLVVTGAALSTFPQFFVWRPDLPHLYGFVPGFAILVAYALFLLWNARAARVARLHRRVPLYAFGAFAAVYLFVFAAHFDGLNLRRDRDYQLRLEKGVNLYLNEWEFQTIGQLYSALKGSTKPGEFVLCFPYCPGINFIADRPTFQKFLYVDNGILAIWPTWIEDMKAEIDAKEPTAIVIHDWAVNDTDFSRFRNWASPLYAHVSERYERKLEVNGFELFVLKEPPSRVRRLDKIPVRS
jgi:hypothetical protein